MHHGGRWLREQIERSGLSKKEFAAHVGTTGDTLRYWFNNPSPTPRMPALMKLAKMLKLSTDELQQKLHGPRRSFSDMLAPGVPIGENGEIIDSKGRIVNVLKPAGSLVQYVPIINAISASSLIDRTGSEGAVGIAGDRVPIPRMDTDAFALIVDGHCMSPRYEHGDIVVFKTVDDARKIVSGRDYAIQFDAESNEESTFKRLFLDKRHPHTATARCLNPDFAGKEFTIDLRHVIRLGVAVFTYYSEGK